MMMMMMMMNGANFPHLQPRAELQRNQRGSPHPPRPTTAQIEIDHNTGHYVPYSLRTVRAFFYVPQFIL